MLDLTEMLTPSQAGRRLDRSREWVSLAVRSGRMAAVRTPLGWLVAPDEVERVRREIEQRDQKRAPVSA